MQGRGKTMQEGGKNKQKSFDNCLTENFWLLDTIGCCGVSLA